METCSFVCAIGMALRAGTRRREKPSSGPVRLSAFRLTHVLTNSVLGSLVLSKRFPSLDPTSCQYLSFSDISSRQWRFFSLYQGTELRSISSLLPHHYVHYAASTVVLRDHRRGLILHAILHLGTFDCQSISGMHDVTACADIRTLGPSLECILSLIASAFCDSIVEDGDVCTNVSLETLPALVSSIAL